MEHRKWTLRGLDTFEGPNAFYDIEGEYDTEEEVRAAAQAHLRRLEQDQPSSSSGGQFRGGIQDRVYIISPSGARQRV